MASGGDIARYPGCEQVDDCAYVVSSDNFEQALAAALEEIALDAMSCAFDVPSVNSGVPDHEAVNIAVESGGQTSTVPRDQIHADGWDYLPGYKQVQLYGSACELLEDDITAKVEIAVGCETQQS